MLSNFEFLENALKELESMDAKPIDVQVATIRVVLIGLLREGMKHDDRTRASQEIDEP